MSTEPTITGTQILPTLNHIKTVKNKIKTIEIKGGYDVTKSKPDVHINPGFLNQNGNMISIKSTTRLTNTPYKPNFIPLNSQLQFDFNNMTNICRPERDNSTKTPLLRTMQSLRKYKLGSSPDYKLFLLKEDLFKVLDSDVYDGNVVNKKNLLNAFSNNNNNTQEIFGRLEITNNHIMKQDLIATDDDISLYDDEISIGSREKTNHIIIKDNKNKKAIDKKVKKSKKLIVNPDLAYVNTDLYRMESPLNISLTSDEQQPLYTPATFRLPKTEQVIGFGISNAIIDEKLSAYRVHANAAIQAAAALEEASVVESIVSETREPFDSYAGDTYEESRKESFLIQNSSDMNDSSINNDIFPIDASQHYEYITLIDLPVDTTTNEQIRHMAVSSPPKKGRLHCCKCFRSASLWCRKCVSAYCGICWGQVFHHDLTQMMYDSEFSSKIEAIDKIHDKHNNNTLIKSIIPDKVLSKNNSYSKSVMFQKNPFVVKELKNNNIISNSTAAMIPLPSYVITRYEEYPQSPVYITGTGAVQRHRDSGNSPMRRPYTAPVTTQSELHQLQMNNHFTRKIQLDNKKEMNSKYSNEYIHSNMLIKSGLHYEQDYYLKLKNDLKHSKGQIMIRQKPTKMNSSVRINTTPPISTGSTHRGVDCFVPYSSKPSSSSKVKPLTGITNNIIFTTDWKKDLFLNNSNNK